MRDKGSNGSSVTATQLGRHLDLSRQRVQQLVDEYVITRLPDGRFDQDDSRVRYMRWYGIPIGDRYGHRPMPSTSKPKLKLLQLKLAEKRGELVRQTDVDAPIDELVGVTLTAMTASGAVCASWRSCDPALH